MKNVPIGQLQYVADLPSRRRGRLRSSTSSFLDVRPSRLVTVGDRSFAAADPGTVYLSTSSLPRHSQHFVRLIYFGNHTLTLLCSCVAIVVLEVTLSFI